MKVRHWVENGKALSKASLDAADKHDLRTKNIKMLREQVAWKNVFLDTVSFSDREVQASDNNS